MQELDNDLIVNYEQVREDRGWSYEQLAEHVGTTDRRLAAYFRQMAEGDSEETPEGRTPNGGLVDAAAAEQAAQVAQQNVGGTVSAEQHAGEQRQAELDGDPALEQKPSDAAQDQAEGDSEETPEGDKPKRSRGRRS